MHASLSDATLIDLIEHIYAAGCDPALWQSFVEHAHAQFPGIAFNLQLATCGAGPLAHSAGIPTEHIASYLAHYYKLNPYTAIFDTLQVGRVHTTTSHGTRQWIRNEPFYHEWLKPAGNLTHGASAVIARDPRRSFRISLDISEQRAELEAAGAELLRRLLPHLRRAFEINDRLQASVTTESSLNAVLDRIDGAALVLGTDATVLALNRRAEDITRSGSLLRIAQPGCLSLRSPGDTCKLRRSLAVALGAYGHCAPLAFVCQDSELGEVRIVVLPLRLTGASAATPVTPPRALLVAQPAARPSLPKDLLKALYRLTNAEAGVVLQLASGASIAGTAERLGVTLTTARNQLASAMSKMGVHRQAELVAALAALAPTLRLDEPE